MECTKLLDVNAITDVRETLESNANATSGNKIDIRAKGRKTKVNDMKKVRPIDDV